MSGLSAQNHWWREGRVRPQLNKEFKRNAFVEAEKLMSVRQVTVISGLRRVGKSTMMMQLIQGLIDRGIEPLDILYFSFDERVENVRELMGEYGELTGRDYESKKIYVFLDEVQKAKAWADQVKILYDSLPSMKIVLSGSAVLSLVREARATLAGRAFYVDLKPLSFKEFVSLKHNIEIPIDRLAVWEDRLNAWFPEYLKRPLPEMVEMPEELLRRYVRESIVDRILYKDIAEAHGRVDYELLRTMLDLFLTNPGYYLNVDSLSKDLKRSKRTILNTMEYMKESYLIRVVKNFRPSAMSSSRKLRRVYPYHFCLISHETVEQARLMECVAASILDAVFYWREGRKEVDFVVEGNPVEVKWQDNLTTEDFRSVKYFARKYKADRPILVTKPTHPRMPIDEERVSTIAMWKVAFQEKLWN